MDKLRMIGNIETGRGLSPGMFLYNEEDYQNAVVGLFVGWLGLESMCSASEQELSLKIPC